MLYLTLSFCMVLPLFGVMAMEAGEISPFVDEPGRANGASIAYAVHLLAFFVAFVWVLQRHRRSRLAIVPAQPRTRPQAPLVDRFALVSAMLFIVLAVLMVFAYGGINVLTLDVDKAEFRVSLGPLGAIMTLATKWVMPAMFAALVRAFSDLGWTLARRLVAGICAVCICIVGASWGFKTTILGMLLPAFILLSWRLRPRTLALLGAFILLNVVGLSLFFDQSEDLGVALDALLYRLTALQGDLAWYTWDRVVDGAETPPYLRTYLPVFGDAVLRLITGADPARDYAGWASYYFGPSMTLYGGYPVEGLMNGVSNQATMFAEVLLIGGKYLFAIPSLVFGALTGFLTLRLRAAIDAGRYALAATLATFFSFTVLSWTLGNGFSSLFYLINTVGAFGTYLLLCSQLPVRRRVRRPAP
jgi:hypothetical protein